MAYGWTSYVSCFFFYGPTIVTSHVCEMVSDSNSKRKRKELLRNNCSFHYHGNSSECLTKMLNQYQNKQINPLARLPPYRTMFTYKMSICSYNSLCQSAHSQILPLPKCLLADTTPHRVC